MGIAEFSPERMIGIVVDARVALPSSVNSRAFIAYSGTYRFDGDEFITSVDSASDLTLVGTEQKRRVKFDGTCMIVSPINEVLATQPGSLEFVWERVGTDSKQKTG
jgi:hypothetical protein